MNKQMVNVIVVVCIVVLLLALFIIPIVYNINQGDKQSIQFNGQTLDLSGASNIMVQSSDDQRVFAADEQQGAVTQTTSIVTVTIWMKP